VRGLAITLLVVGGLLQFAGIVAIAWPDFLPWKERTSAWLRAVHRRAENCVRHLFHRPESVVVQSGTATMALAASGRHSIIKGVPAEATIDEKVAFLLERDRQAQEAEQRLDADLDDLKREGEQRLDEARDAMEEHVETRLAKAHNEYRPLRIVGAFFLAVGIGCQVAGSIII
jgi:hypothetical protein